MVNIREARESELDAVLSVERAAFGGDIEANLVKALLGDPSAQPSLSLLAFENEKAVGHILFTRAVLNTDAEVSLSILAPLAVLPDHQGLGIGGRLVETGFEWLQAAGVDLVFVLGYPDYYNRFGFEPAGRLGFQAPFPIPENNADAWMLKGLKPQAVDGRGGVVACADVLNRAEYWRE